MGGSAFREGVYGQRELIFLSDLGFKRVEQRQKSRVSPEDQLWDARARALVTPAR